jgi:hypothetical protein
MARSILNSQLLTMGRTTGRVVRIFDRWGRGVSNEQSVQLGPLLFVTRNTSETVFSSRVGVRFRSTFQDRTDLGYLYLSCTWARHGQDEIHTAVKTEQWIMQIDLDNSGAA